MSSCKATKLLKLEIPLDVFETLWLTCDLGHPWTMWLTKMLQDRQTSDAGLCASLRNPRTFANSLNIYWIYCMAQSFAVKVADCAAYELFREQQPEAKKNRQSNPTWPYILFGPVSDMLINCNTRIYHYLPWLRSISGCNRQLPWRYNWHIWHVDRLRLLLVPSLASLSGSLLRWWLRASCPMIKVSQSWRQDMAGHSLWPKFYDLYTSVWHCMANIGKSCNILTL